MHVIRIDDVRKTYGTVAALDGVSLSVGRGETFGLVGTNGAGKTTLFRLLVGHETPDSGSITVAGHTPSEGVAVRNAVGFVPEDAGFEPALTGREVLGYYARLRGVPGGERDHRVEQVLSTVGLADAADRRIGGYSNGMCRRLALATTLLTRPEVLLLDEPTAGLDPEGVADFRDLVARLATTEMTVVVTSHDLREVEALCDRAAVLDDGAVVERGTVEDLRGLADDGVTVSASLADPEADLSPLRARPGVAVDRDGRRVVVRCPDGDAGTVLDEMRDATDLERFEVTRPDLQDAFCDAVATDGGERR